MIQKKNPAPEKRAGFPNFERWYWMERAKVYFTPEISPDALQRMYHAFGALPDGQGGG